MNAKILLNSTEYNFSQNDLPLLIHGKDATGASMFSISVIASLYQQGKDIIFLSKYEGAKDAFDEQTVSKDKSIFLSGGFTQESIHNKRVIYIPSEQPDLLGKIVESLDDLPNKVIFFKNFDLFDETIFAYVKDLPNLIMMGDLDKCPYSNHIINKNWQSKIYFSGSKNVALPNMPKLQKYTGCFRSKNIEGIVNLSI